MKNGEQAKWGRCPMCKWSFWPKRLTHVLNDIVFVGGKVVSGGQRHVCKACWTKFGYEKEIGKKGISAIRVTE